MPGCVVGAILKVLTSIIMDSPFEKPGLVGAEGIHLTIWEEPLIQQAGQTYEERFKLDLSGEGDGLLGNREAPGAADILGTNRQTPLKCPKGIRAFSFKKVTWLIAQLKCPYTNVHSIITNKRSWEPLCS